MEQFKKFISQNSLRSSECVVIGDDSNDIELFKITRHGIAVESPTSSVLESFAWKKIKDLVEIKNIL